MSSTKADVADSSWSQSVLSWILLGGFLFVCGLAEGVYAAREVEPSGRYVLLTTAGLLVLLWYWFSQQVAKHKPRLMMDMGLFIVILWFILVPYYLWRYERWRGLAKVACLFGMFVAARTVTAVVYRILS